MKNFIKKIGYIFCLMFSFVAAPFRSKIKKQKASELMWESLKPKEFDYQRAQVFSVIVTNKSKETIENIEVLKVWRALDANSEFGKNDFIDTEKYKIESVIKEISLKELFIMLFRDETKIGAMRVMGIGLIKGNYVLTLVQKEKGGAISSCPIRINKYFSIFQYQTDIVQGELHEKINPTTSMVLDKLLPESSIVINFYFTESRNILSYDTKITD